MCVFVALDTQHANVHAPYCHLSSAPLHNINPNILTKGTIFEKMLLNTKCVFWFPLQLMSEIRAEGIPPLLHASYITIVDEPH